MVTMLAIFLAGVVNANEATPMDKVQHLLYDVQETVRKNALDASVIDAAYNTFHEQLAASLENEVKALSHTRGALEDAQKVQMTHVADADKELDHLKNAVSGSTEIAGNYEQGGGRVGKKFAQVVRSVEALIALLKVAVVTPDGTLITQEEPDEHGTSSSVIGAVKKILTAHRKLTSDKLYFAFVNSTNVQMTPELLADTVKTLEAIKGELKGKQTDVLTQYEERRQRYLADATLTSAGARKKEGLVAESHRHSEEVQYAVDFTKAVLEKDNAMLVSLGKYGDGERKIRADLATLKSRQAATLQNVIDVISGKYKNFGKDDGESSEPAPAFSAQGASHMQWLWEKHADNDKTMPSFLQVGQQSSSPGSLVSIRSEIEKALKDKQDTHGILLHIQQMLGEGTPDADNVRHILTNLQSLMKEVETFRPQMATTKEKCQEQLYRLSEAQAAVDSSKSLMASARGHLKETRNAAQSNLAGVGRKLQALSDLLAQAKQVEDQTAKMYKNEAKDRETILLALAKAEKVARENLPVEETAGVTLLAQLESEFKEITALEKVHRQSQKDLYDTFDSYIRDYKQLLQDRSMHYDTTLAELQLNYNELDADTEASTDELQTTNELQSMDANYCSKVVSVYDAQKHRQEVLLREMRKVLPKIPDLLSIDSDSPPSFLQKRIF